MRKVFIFLCFLFASSIWAQVPGYLGKRVHINAGIHFFPQFSNVPVNIVQPRGQFVISGMNYRLVLATDFVITRKSVIGLNGHYFNTAGPVGGLEFSSYYNLPDRRYAIEGGAVGFVFKTHFGPWVAPLGPYYKVEVGAIVNSTSDPANNYNGNFAPETFASGYLTTGVGRNHIFANRITLDYGGEMGLLLPPVTSTSTGNTSLRMTIQYLATFYMKVGVIL
jgi:hypothetical protein